GVLPWAEPEATYSCSLYPYGPRSNWLVSAGACSFSPVVPSGPENATLELLAAEADETAASDDSAPSASTARNRLPRADAPLAPAIASVVIPPRRPLESRSLAQLCRFEDACVLYDAYGGAGGACCRSACGSHDRCRHGVGCDGRVARLRARESAAGRDQRGIAQAGRRQSRRP